MTVVQVGGKVTVTEEGVSRGKWRLGKVEELITGKKMVRPEVPKLRC